MATIDVPDELASRIISAIEEFDSIAGQLRRMNRRLDRIEGREEQEALDLSSLIAKVEAETDIDNSIKTLLQGLVEIDPELAALTAKLTPSTAALAAAVKANTGTP